MFIERQMLIDYDPKYLKMQSILLEYNSYMLIDVFGW